MDYRQILQDARGRRVFPAAPEESLILLKATETIPHEGGERFARDSEAYRTLVFKNQPATEGDGWSNQQLLDYGKEVGITGDAYTTFETCFNDQKYGQWVTNNMVTFTNDQVPGTPSLYLNGKEVPSTAVSDITELEKLIAEASGS